MFWSDKHGNQREYKFGVITETPFGREVSEQGGKRLLNGLKPWFHLGQIVIFEVTDGMEPIEIGTREPPEDFNCQYELFEVMNKAIARANEIWE